MMLVGVGVCLGGVRTFQRVGDGGGEGASTMCLYEFKREESMGLLFEGKWVEVRFDSCWSMDTAKNRDGDGMRELTMPS